MTDAISSLNNNVPASPQFGTDLLAQINAALAAIQPLSATEAGYLDGVTAGTSAASKAVVLGSNSKIDTLDITTLKVNGKEFGYGTITLAANAVTTTVTDAKITTTSRIVLTATSANAAADVGSATGVYISAKNASTSFVVTHPNNANADKTFDYHVIY